MSRTLSKLGILIAMVFISAMMFFDSSKACADVSSFEWSVSDDGTLTITGEGIIPPYFSPWFNEGGIDSGRIKSIVFSEGITEIGDLAIQALSEVTSVSFPNTLKVIGGQNFCGCKFESISLPEGLVEIDYCSFQECDSLTSVTIPSTVTTIGFGAFTQCASLLNIDVAQGNQVFQSRDGVLFNVGNNSTSLVCYPIGRTDSIYTVPSDTLNINEYVFSESTSLEEVILPRGIRRIEMGAYQDCASLTRLTFPETLTFIGANTFLRCPLFESITIPDSVEYIGDTAFSKNTIICCSKDSAAELYAKRNGNRIIYLDELYENVLPSNLTAIEEESLYSTAFDTIYISPDVIAIGANAFSKNTIIICVPDSVADIWARENDYLVFNIPNS